MALRRLVAGIVFSVMMAFSTPQVGAQSWWSACWWMEGAAHSWHLCTDRFLDGALHTVGTAYGPQGGQSKVNLWAYDWTQPFISPGSLTYAAPGWLGMCLNNGEYPQITPRPPGTVKVAHWGPWFAGLDAQDRVTQVQGSRQISYPAASYGTGSAAFGGKMCAVFVLY